MSAVLKPLEPPDSHSDNAASIAIDQRHLQVVPPAHPSADTLVFPTPSQRDRPVWLKLLMMGQRVSLVMAAMTVTGALSAYALTVDNNRRLTTATATLSSLQDYQQQITTANAVLKNHLIQAANAAVQDGTLHPRDVIFLETTQSSAEPSTTDAKQRTAGKPEPRFFPKGY